MKTLRFVSMEEFVMSVWESITDERDGTRKINCTNFSAYIK